MGTVQHNPLTGARGIEWCDETRNVFGGCVHACRWRMPGGEVARCYAEVLAEEGLAKAGYPHGFAHHYHRGPKALRELVAGGAPQLIFCDSMSDMFSAAIPEAELVEVLDAMGTDGGHHVYQALTKAPKRLRKFAGRLPPNLWAGISSAPDFMLGRELSREQQTRYMHVALETLAEVRAATGNVVWMSIEPLSWDVSGIIAAHPGVLDWVVIGAASAGRRYYQPAAADVARLLDALDAQGVAVFYKGNIKPLFEVYDFGTPDKNRWREEFPVRGPAGDFDPAPAVVRRQRLARRYGWTLNPRLPETAEARPATPPTPVQPSLF